VKMIWASRPELVIVVEQTSGTYLLSNTSGGQLKKWEYIAVII